MSWTAKPLLLALFVLAFWTLSTRAAFATGEQCRPTDAVEPPPTSGPWQQSEPEMSSEAKLVGEPGKDAFKPDPTRYDVAYAGQEQIDIYGTKHLNPTANPPFLLGRRLYDRGAYL